MLADVLAGANPQARYRGSKLYTRLKVAGVDVASMGTRRAGARERRGHPDRRDRRDAYRKLIVRDGKLVGAMLVGNTEAAASLVQIFDRGDPLPDDPLEVLCPNAAFGAGAPADRLVCNCHKVTESRLCEAIAAGAGTVEALGELTKAGTGCGSCKRELVQLLAKQAPPPKLAAAG